MALKSTILRPSHAGNRVSDEILRNCYCRVIMGYDFPFRMKLRNCISDIAGVMSGRNRSAQSACRCTKEQSGNTQCLPEDYIADPRSGIGALLVLNHTGEHYNDFSSYELIQYAFISIY